MPNPDSPTTGNRPHHARRVALAVTFGTILILGGLVIAFFRPLEERYWMWRIERDPELVAWAVEESPNHAARAALERLVRGERGLAVVGGAYARILIECLVDGRELQEFLGGGELTNRYRVLGITTSALDHETPGSVELGVTGFLRGGSEKEPGAMRLHLDFARPPGQAVARLEQLLDKSMGEGPLPIDLPAYPTVRFELHRGTEGRNPWDGDAPRDTIAVVGFTRMPTPDSSADG